MISEFCARCAHERADRAGDRRCEQAGVNSVGPWECECHAFLRDAAALTRAWRLIGQPITVLLPTHHDPVGDIAATWAAEHELAGIRTEHRTSDASSEPCVVVPADRPAPYCGCVHPPCTRCLAEPQEAAR